MDTDSGKPDGKMENSLTKESTASQQQTYTVFPPCVVHNIHEITAAKSMTDKDVAINHVQDGGDTMETTHSSKVKTCFSKASTAIIWALERGFFRVGFFVGQNPVVTIVAMVIMCALCGLGMKTFEESEEQEKLWVPQASRVIPEKKWVDRVFPEETRYVSILVVEPKGDVLTPKFINGLMDYYNESLRAETNGRNFKDLCVRVGPSCYVSSLLELWFYNEQVIRSLSRNDILQKINSTLVSPISGVEVKTLLGGDITFDDYGTILSAEATQITWLLRKEEDNDNAADWEKQMIDLAVKGHPNIDKTYVYATRSFDDEGYGAINNDIQLLTAGFSIVFVFVMLSLGKFNLIEQKIYVSLSGMACVGLSILVAYGIATALSVIYSPIQSIMPFLLLGIGVDDMFVVVETWKNLSPEEEKLDIPNKLAVTMSRAGLSVTVTSITDIVAFGIGATTVIPALSSFCIYASLGIFALFALVSTVFAAVLALDERRRRAGRDACLCCYRHSENYRPNRCSTGKSFMQAVFTNYYGPLLTKLPFKIFIIFISVGMASLGLWRFILMKQDFDLINYIPSDSYAYTYARTKEDYFNREGVDTHIYCGGFNYFEQQNHLDAMYDKVIASEFIQPGTINSWFTAFHTAMNIQGKNITKEEDYYQELFRFIHSPSGQRFASFVKLNSSTEPVSVVASYVRLKHTLQPNSQRDVEGMDALRDIVDSAGFPKFEGEDMPEYMCFAYTRNYLSYETNKVLQRELYRNLGLAAGAVFIVTLVLIANLWTSVLVLICVLFTVVDVGGILEVWGTTIDTASSILLTVAVGLAVDYSAHIGHTFMTIKGSRNNRAVVTLKTIGPAVFNGGFSTFLAFVLLANSSSYGFQLFFRVFLSVVFFGLFHGLALLPVILSLAGPKAYEHSDEIPDNITMTVGEVSNGTVKQNKDQPMANGHSELDKRAFDGPIHSLYENHDDVEMKDTARLSTMSRQMPAVLEKQPDRPYISVIDVNMSASIYEQEKQGNVTTNHIDFQQQHNQAKFKPNHAEESLTKL